MEGNYTEDTIGDSGKLGKLETLPGEVKGFLESLPVTPNVPQIMQEYHLHTTRVPLGGELAVRISDMPADQFDHWLAPVLDESVLQGDSTARSLWLPRHRLAAINRALQTGRLRKFALPPWGYLIVPIVLLLGNYFTP